MKAAFYSILILACSAVAGWLIADSDALGLVEQSSSVKQPIAPKLQSQPAEKPPAEMPVAAPDPDEIFASQLADLRSLRGSPQLSAGYWMGDDERIIDPGFPHLARWLKLSEAQRVLLAGILRSSANARRAWELANLHAERSQVGSFHVNWIDHDDESLPALKQALASEFGDELAEAIFLRGNLHRFFEPVPGWNTRRTDDISLEITARPGSGILLKLTNGNWSQSLPWSEKEFPVRALPRLEHVFDYSADAEAIFNSSKETEYPSAKNIAGKPGYVVSPYSERQIDVRNIPPGTLVNDPNFPSSQKAYFRIPNPISATN
ncbi:hypothetical protein JIN85_16320 [Luteolibacter pohnpeiensis]|uniref:Uncharacterized protein n=1 Tax=Luteolibacter pohnpeiensis TaxID=454153 RepID=A0A934VS73_9BACT|nr:hypothetical protein [Luteolibacter pohnpeiensis]MBK1883986.1 hypothetical protein [Luteolibacter pohnpeiensis]